MPHHCNACGKSCSAAGQCQEVPSTLWVVLSSTCTLGAALLACVCSQVRHRSCNLNSCPYVECCSVSCIVCTCTSTFFRSHSDQHRFSCTAPCTQRCMQEGQSWAVHKLYHIVQCRLIWSWLAVSYFVGQRKLTYSTLQS